VNPQKSKKKRSTSTNQISKQIKHFQKQNSKNKILGNLCALHSVFLLGF